MLTAKTVLITIIAFSIVSVFINSHQSLNLLSTIFLTELFSVKSQFLTKFDSLFRIVTLIFVSSGFLTVVLPGLLHLFSFKFIFHFFSFSEFLQIFQQITCLCHACIGQYSMLFSNNFLSQYFICSFLALKHSLMTWLPCDSLPQTLTTTQLQPTILWGFPLC